MKINKKIFIFVTIIFILILIISITIYYKNQKSGNNTINKSDEQIVQDILNISSYNAKIEIEVNSNKNSNKYIIKQEVKKRISKQEVLEPENIQGLVTEYDGKNLKIVNNKLNLTTLYENYEYIANNTLWLNSFIEEYKSIDNESSNEYKNLTINENSNVNENSNLSTNTDTNTKRKKVVAEENQIILEIEDKENKYNTYKTLYIDKKTKKPTKMMISDINKKDIVYILYTEIEIS